MNNTSSLVIPRFLLPLFLLISLGAPAQPPPSPGQNFIRVERPRVRVSSEKKLTLLSAEEKATTYHYFYAFGRKVMTTTGRQDRTYLGYAKTYAMPGQFVDAVAEARVFYEKTTLYRPKMTPLAQRKVRARGIFYRYFFLKAQVHYVDHNKTMRIKNYLKNIKIEWSKPSLWTIPKILNLYQSFPTC